MGVAVKIRVLIVSKYPMIRKFLRTVVNASPDMEVVGEAEGTSSALQKYSQFRPDVVVGESEGDSTSLRDAAKFVEEIPDARVVVLTTVTDPGYIRSMLAAGITGYVLKQSNDTEMISAIRYANQRRKFLDPGLVDSLAYLLVGGKKPPKERSSRPTLNKREEEVLKALVQGHTNAEIAKKLQLSTKTVETYRARIYSKLKIRGRADLFRYAIALGLISVHDTPGKS